MTGEQGDDFSFWDHLQAFRRVLWQMVLVVLVLFPPGWWAASPLLDLYIGYACPPELGALNYFTPMEVFLVQMKMGLLLAVGAGFPVLAYLFWHFLQPALYPHERSCVGWNVAIGYLLFLGGCTFSLAAMVPLVMRFSAGFAAERLHPMIGLGAFLELAFWLTLSFGVMFQMPLVVIGLCRLGIVRVDALRRKRPLIVVVVLIIAGILTPPDVVSQLMLAVPTLMLFEVGLWFAARAERRRDAGRMASEDTGAGDADIPPAPPMEPQLPPGTGDLTFYSHQAKRGRRRPIRSSRRR